jgi:serine/threonine protein kinase
MTCPSCAVSALSPDTGTCEVCGYRLDGSEVVEGQDVLAEVVARQLEHEFDIRDIAGRREGSVVLRAVERSSGRKVILKARQRRADDPESEERFRNIMESYSQLDHPNLIPVLGFGATDSLLCCAMLDVGGQSLRATLKEEGRLAHRETLRLATQLVNALEYLHRRGIVHGAVKPENVIVDLQGWARLVDPTFGRRDPMRRRRTGLQLISTEDAPRQSWVAPEEHVGGERTPATDQFALAALVFECITGERPLKPGEEASRFRPDVPAAMSSAVARALDAQPTRRFASCMDFLSALGPNTPKPPAEDRPSGRISTDALLIDDWEPPEPAATPRRNPIAIGGIIIAIVAIALVTPTLITKFQAARAPEAPEAMVAPLPVTLPSAPVPAPPPSTQRVTGGTVNEAPARSTTRTSVGNRAPVAPSSIPRVSTAAPAPTTEVAATARAAAATARAAAAPAAVATAPASVAATPAGDTAAGTGKLSVNAKPWGQVFVDDRLIGNTPRANIELPAGTHTLRVSRQGFESVTRSVTIVAGETLRITDIVLTPVAP